MRSQACPKARGLDNRKPWNASVLKYIQIGQSSLKTNRQYQAVWTKHRLKICMPWKDTKINSKHIYIFKTILCKNNIYLFLIANLARLCSKENVENIRNLRHVKLIMQSKNGFVNTAKKCTVWHLQIMWFLKFYYTPIAGNTLKQIIKLIFHPNSIVAYCIW